MFRDFELLETPWGETVVEKPQFPQVNQDQFEDSSQQCLADVTDSSPLPPMGRFQKRKMVPPFLFHKHHTVWERCKLYLVGPKIVEQIVVNA